MARCGFQALPVLTLRRMLCLLCFLLSHLLVAPSPPDRTEPGGTQLWRSLCPEAFLYSGGSAGLDACWVNSDSIFFLSLLPLSALPGKCRMTCLPDETSLFVQVVSPASNDTPDMLMK